MILCCRGCGLTSQNFPGADEATNYQCSNCSGKAREVRSLTYDYQPRQRESAEREVARWSDTVHERGRAESRSEFRELLRLFGPAAGLTAQEDEVWRACWIEGRTVRGVEEETGVSKSNVGVVADHASRKLTKAVGRAKENRNLGIEETALLMRWSEIVGDEWESAEQRKDRWGHRIRYDSRGVEITSDDPDN